MNGLLQLLTGGKAKTEENGAPPKFNPLWMSADGYEQGLQMRQQYQQQRDANGFRKLLSQGDMEGARKHALDTGNFGAVTSLDEMIGRMDERQLAETKRKAGIVAGLLQPLLNVPEGEREQYRGQIMQRLQAQGFTAQELQALDLSGFGIQSDINMAIGLEQRMEGRSFTEMGDQLVVADTATGQAGNAFTRAPSYSETTTRQNNEATQHHNQNTLAETARHNRASEANAAVTADAARTRAETAGGGPNGMGELGLTPIYARDKNGNRIALQTSKAGGLYEADVPEGYTLEDERYKEFGKTQGRELAKRDLSQTKIGMKISNGRARLSLVQEQINRAIEQSNKWNTGAIAGRNPFATDLQATMDTIAANIGFGELQKMRDESPTGGALGQVTEKEIAFLQALIGSITRMQGDGQLDANLARMSQEIADSFQRMEDAYVQDYEAGLFKDLPRAGALQDDLSGIEGLSDEELLRQLGTN